MMDYEGGTLPLSGAVSAGGRAAVCSLCVAGCRAVGLSGLMPLISDEMRIRYVSMTMRYIN